MSNIVLISVDGRHGSDSDASKKLDATRKALTKISTDLDGQDGDDAFEVLPGAPGGYLSVELLSAGSNLRHPNGIRVEVRKSQSTVDLPVSMNVTSGQNLLITARGGNGEDGGIGGSGQNGKGGIDGTPATEDEDATNGTNGGKGGSGGAGSHGGNGGNGGTVEIIVNEHDTNLLLAVDWNVDPGNGGKPGRNGLPGKGGLGGKGGNGFSWSEVSGFRYSCTPRCRGGGQTDPGFMALTGPRTRTATNDRFEVTMNGDIGIRLLGDGRDVVNNRRNLTVSGTTTIPANSGITWEEALVDTVLRTAGQNSSALIPSMPTNLCRCHGGSTHCVGCDREPTMVKQTRARGLDGRDGPAGKPSTFQPREGAAGIPGLAYITVKYADGKTGTFHSKYKIELVDFQVVDENDDGIIEPGEHIFIQHIQIRNSGGMPTPSSQIPVTVQESEWILPSSTSENIFLPKSVQPGHTAYIPGKIKAFVKNDRLGLLEIASAFKALDRVKLKAVMPGLNRELPSFEFSREIEIAYPLELIRSQNLDCVPLGLKTTFTWKVHNKSTKAYGISSSLGRRASTCLSVQPRCGITLMNSATDGQGRTNKEIGSLEPGETATFSEVAKIAPDAEPYSRSNLKIELLLSSPGTDTPASVIEKNTQRTIQEQEHQVQISTRYTYSEESEFLLVTNSQTSSDVLAAWTHFIQDELAMSLDTWNISLYGGLQFADDDDTVLSSYMGKTVIMLANSFDYFGKGNRTVMDLCDPIMAATEVLLDTKLEILVSPSLNTHTINEWMRSLIFPIQYVAENPEDAIQPTMLQSEKDIIESVANQYLSGNQEFTIYKIPVKTSRILNAENQLRRKAKQALRYLLEYLPQERFCITPTSQDASPSQAGYLVISRGLPHFTQAVVRRQAGPSAIGVAKGGLGLRDTYACISSLSFCKRVEILCNSLRRRQDLQLKNEPISQDYSGRIIEAVKLSITHELYREVHRFLLHSAWPDHLLPKKSDTDFLRRHFRRFYDFLSHESVAQNVSPPQEVTQILTILLSITRPQSFKQLAHQILVPMCHRRTRLWEFMIKSIEAVFLTRYSQAAVEEHLQLLKSAGKSRMPKKTKNIILSSIGTFTGQSRHEVEFGTGAGNVSSDWFQSEIFSEIELERQRERYRLYLDRLGIDVKHSQTQLMETIVGS